MYKYRNECPSVKWVPQGGQKFLGKLVKGGGPIGEFLYEVGEMKIGSQMGQLMMDEMEGSWSCGCAGKKELKHKAMIWESIWEASKNEEKKYVVDSQHDEKDYQDSHP